MLARYQNECLTTIKRRDGIDRWLIRWIERPAHGSRETNKVIGLVTECLKGSKKLQETGARLRQQINIDGPKTMSEVVEHYVLHELRDSEDGKEYSTRDRKECLLERWVVPK